MSSSSSIEWTGSTWNPVTGCSKISPGCKNCYAERMAKRLKAMGQQNYVNGFNVTMHEHVIELPMRWKKPQTIFVNSMSDLFHENVTDEFIFKIFNLMNKTHWHTYQILTKRSERLARMSNKLSWKPNIWMGVSVENQNYLYRIDDLRKTKAHIRFISFEPLLGPVNTINLKGIDWAIVGGESGPRARKMEESWVIEIRDHCVKKDVPFFFKQWGGVHKKKLGRRLEGKFWNGMPEYSNVLPNK